MDINKIIAVLLISIGISINLYNLINKRKEKIEEYYKIEYTLDKEISYNNMDKEVYDSILSIPKINLRKGLYKIEDKKNNIEENIMIHKESIYPDKDNSNMILIAHSGSGSKALFNDLDKLDTDTLIEFYYKHSKYIYKIDSIYCIEKNGKAKIDKDESKKSITLITCSRKDKTKQVVYIGYLIDEIKY